MEYKKAIAILTGLLKNQQLNGEEKEAVTTAIGVLDCAAIGENQMKSYIRAKKSKREESLKW
jgi:hypothetical protein